LSLGHDGTWGMMGSWTERARANLYKKKPPSTNDPHVCVRVEE
jgi:hypothetical protein